MEKTLIFNKVLEHFGLEQESVQFAAGTKILTFILDTMRPFLTKVNFEPSQKAILSKFLEEKTLTVYLDDLDRGWEGTKSNIKRISALLNAIRDLSNENPGLKFRVALRSDVYFLVRTSDESTDKIEGSVVWLAWTNQEILVMLIKRIETFFRHNVNEKDLMQKKTKELAIYLDQIMEPTFSGKGKWENAPMYRILMSLIRKRPRDLVKLCTLAARMAYDRDSSVISTVDFQSIFEDYSQGRIQDAINEYRSEFPEIERLLMGMKPSKKEKSSHEAYTYSTDKLIDKINNIIEQGVFRFANGNIAEAKQLIHFLYKINFLTARKTLATGEIQRKYFEESRYLSNDFADFGYAWEIHPAYRWALQPDSIEDIFAHVDLCE